MSSKVDIERGAYEILPNVIRRRFDAHPDNSMRAVARCLAENERQSNEIAQRMALARIACLAGSVEIRRIGILEGSKLHIADPLVSDSKLSYPLWVTRNTFTLGMQAKLIRARKIDISTGSPCPSEDIDSSATVAELKVSYSDDSTKLLYEDFAKVFSGANDEEVITRALDSGSN